MPRSYDIRQLLDNPNVRPVELNPGKFYALVKLARSSATMDFA